MAKIVKELWGRKSIITSIMNLFKGIGPGSAKDYANGVFLVFPVKKGQAEKRIPPMLLIVKNKKIVGFKVYDYIIGDKTLNTQFNFLTSNYKKGAVNVQLFKNIIDQKPTPEDFKQIEINLEKEENGGKNYSSLSLDVESKRKFVDEILIPNIVNNNKLRKDKIITKSVLENINQNIFDKIKNTITDAAEQIENVELISQEKIDANKKETETKAESFIYLLSKILLEEDTQYSGGDWVGVSADNIDNIDTSETDDSQLDNNTEKTSNTDQPKGVLDKEAIKKLNEELDSWIKKLNEITTEYPEDDVKTKVDEYITQINEVKSGINKYKDKTKKEFAESDISKKYTDLKTLGDRLTNENTDIEELKNYVVYGEKNAPEKETPFIEQWLKNLKTNSVNKIILFSKTPKIENDIIELDIKQNTNEIATESLKEAEEDNPDTNTTDNQNEDISAQDFMELKNKNNILLFSVKETDIKNMYEISLYKDDFEFLSKQIENKKIIKIVESDVEIKLMSDVLPPDELYAYILNTQFDNLDENTQKNIFEEILKSMNLSATTNILNLAETNTNKGPVLNLKPEGQFYHLEHKKNNLYANIQNNKPVMVMQLIGRDIQGIDQRDYTALISKYSEDENNVKKITEMFRDPSKGKIINNYATAWNYITEFHEFLKGQYNSKNYNEKNYVDVIRSFQNYLTENKTQNIQKNSYTYNIGNMLYEQDEPNTSETNDGQKKDMFYKQFTELDKNVQKLWMDFYKKEGIILKEYTL